MKIKIIVISIFIFIFTGCSKIQLEDFTNKTPEFNPKEYFNGPLIAYGLVKDRSGKVIKTFRANFVGSWDENGIGTLDEKFVYDNGEKQTRVWTLTPIQGKEKTYKGTAGDIVGEALMQANGNTVMMDYTITVPYNDSTIDLNVRDWLHLQEDGVILSHSKMKKFGFVVGELVTTIIKQ